MSRFADELRIIPPRMILALFLLAVLIVLGLPGAVVATSRYLDARAEKVEAAAEPPGVLATNLMPLCACSTIRLDGPAAKHPVYVFNCQCPNSRNGRAMQCVISAQAGLIDTDCESQEHGNWKAR